MGNILRISLKPNFTPNILGCYGLILKDEKVNTGNNTKNEKFIVKDVKKIERSSQVQACKRIQLKQARFQTECPRGSNDELEKPSLS